MGQFVEQPLGDGVVSAFAVPHAALVATAEMDTESNAREAFDHVGFGLERTGEVRHRVLAAIAHLLHRRLVDVGGEARRVDLDVTATGIDQTFDDRPLDRDHVGDKIVHAFVYRGRFFIVETL